MLTSGRPFAPRLACGIWYTLSQYTLPKFGEAQQRVVAGRDEQMLDEVFVLHRRRRSAATAAPLRLIVAHRLRLRVAVMRNGHHHVFFGDEIFHRQVELAANDLGEAIVAIRFADRA